MTSGVRIELGIPREHILQLDLDTWHCVLDRRCFPEPLESELRNSLEQVFDFDRSSRLEQSDRVDKIQALTEYVRLDKVANVETFAARS